jgi:hypothetical protein
MMANTDKTAQFIASVLNSLLFFEEFVFAKNKFIPNGQSEVEFADAVVALDDVLIIMQIKERVGAGDADAERKWFEKKVIGSATKQVRDTLQYFGSYDDISIANERGRKFNLAAKGYSEVLKIVVYRGSANLPDDCKLRKFHRSETVGFIHVIEAEDYLEMARVLRVPEDMIRYLRYRELMITKFPDQCRALPEASMLGGYVGDGDDSPPRFNSYENLHRMVLDEETWDISECLRTLRDNTSHPAYENDYYEILQEFIRLPRSAWRDFKVRLQKCIEKVQADEFAQPYRMACPARDIGFMFLPITSDFLRGDKDEEAKINGLITFTQLHKFDQRLRKCIGILVSKKGEFFDVQWCKIVEDWVDDAELRARLDADSPFRPVSEQEQFSYFLHNSL